MPRGERVTHLDLAIEEFLASLSDEDFVELVERTRPPHNTIRVLNRYQEAR